MATVVLNGVDQGYADEEFGEWWSDIAAGLNRNARHTLVLRGNFPCSTPCDFTGFRGGFTIDAFGAQLQWAGEDPGGGTIIELTDSTNTRWHGLSISVDSAFPPDNGIVMGRLAAQSYRSAGKHVFSMLDLSGYFNNAAYYNVSSETDVHMGSRIANLLTTGRYAVYIGDQVRTGDTVTSAFGKVPDHNGSTSSTGNQWWGPQIRNDGTQGTIYVSGFDRLTMTDAYVQASDLADAYVILDTDKKGIINVEFDRIYVHGSVSSQPDVACLLRGRRSNGLVGLLFDARNDGTSAGDFFKVEPNAAPSLVVKEIFGIELRGMVNTNVTFHSTSEVYNALIDSRQDLEVGQRPTITLGAIFHGEIVVADSDSQVVIPGGADVSGVIREPNAVTVLPSLVASSEALEVDGVPVAYAGSDYGAFVNTELAGLSTGDFHTIVLRGEHTSTTAIDIGEFTGGLSIDATQLRLLWDGEGKPILFSGATDVLAAGGRYRVTGDTADRNLFPTYFTSLVRGLRRT